MVWQNILKDDIKIEYSGLRPGEKLYEELLNDTSKTLPTHHEKIMIAQEVCEEFDIISDGVEDLIITAHLKPNNMIVSKMKKLVPEFKSMNSIFQELDSYFMELYTIEDPKERLKKMGAKAKKALPESVLKRAELNDNLLENE